MSLKNRERFTRQLLDNVDRLRNKKLKNVRTIMFAAYSEILVGSPVDTGRFRSNWMIGTETPKRETTDSITAHEKKAPLTGTEAAAAQTELAKLGETADKIYITNNLPYAKRLETGHSTQNEGFVERALKRAEIRFRAVNGIKVGSTGAE